MSSGTRRRSRPRVAQHESRSVVGSLGRRLAGASVDSDQRVRLLRRLVASPICQPSGECLATISIVLPEHRVVQDRERYTTAVRKASERIEATLGWR